MFANNPYHPDSQPLGHYKGHPVYLATVLVAGHILAMLIGVVSPQAFLQGLMFAPGSFGSWAQIWRWVTYVFVQQPSLFFILEMFFLYRFGIEIEKIFGRSTLAKLYAGLVLLPPLLVTLAYLANGGPGYPLAGTSFSHFCLFLGICLLYPGALMFSIPWLTLKIAGSLLLGIYVLVDLAARNWMHLGLLLANVALTYFMLRQAGLTPRFEAIAEAFRNALPVRKPAASTPPNRRIASQSGTRSATGPSSKFYEPKIKPKPDLAPERMVVEEIDAILDKIARSGMKSLTAAEKTALQKASSKLKDTDY